MFPHEAYLEVLEAEPAHRPYTVAKRSFPASLPRPHSTSLPPNCKAFHFKVATKLDKEVLERFPERLWHLQILEGIEFVALAPAFPTPMWLSSAYTAT